MASAARLAVAAASWPWPSRAGWWYARRPATTSAPAFANITMRRLTNTGTASLAAISPDGRYVVHVDGDFDKPSLWMRQASTASSVQIVPPMTGAYAGLAFSPDGEAVLYVFGPENGAVPSLFQIPVAGRPAAQVSGGHQTRRPPSRRMARAWRSSAAWPTEDKSSSSPTPTGPTSAVWRRARNRTRTPRRAWPGLRTGPLIAAFAGEMPQQRSRIVLVNVETGKEQVFSDARFDSGGQLVWLGDGSALVFDAVEQYGGRWNWNSQLWSIAYPAGTLRRITPTSRRYANLAATARGRTLVAVRDEVRAGLWVAPDGDTARARPITASSNGREGATGIDWTPDGRIVYSATTQGSWDIWIANSDGSQPRQLTSDPGMENQPRVLPDGTGIVFTSRASGASDVKVRSNRSRRQQPPPDRHRRRHTPWISPGRSATTCISRPWRRDGRWPSACRSAAVRASRCSPIRRGCLRDSSCAASRPMNGGPSARTRTRRVPAWRSCPLTALGRCADFRITYTPGLGFGPELGARRTARSKTWSSATG